MLSVTMLWILTYFFWRCLCCYCPYDIFFWYRGFCQRYFTHVTRSGCDRSLVRFPVATFLEVFACFPFLKLGESVQLKSSMVTDITSFENDLENSSGHTLTLYLNLVKYCFKNMIRKESPTRSCTVI